MALGYANEKKIRNHLERRNNRCPLCGSNHWEIFDDLVSLICFDVEYKRPIEGKIVPIVILICSDCGDIRQISAKKVGLL